MPRPARLKDQLRSPANTPRGKEASGQLKKRGVRQREGIGGQRMADKENQSTHLSNSGPRRHSRAAIIRQVVDLMRDDNLSWPEEVIR